MSVTADPNLGPLQENDGPTPTHALLAGSPALNAGETDLVVDQRGVTRPQGRAADIGAFEVFVLDGSASRDTDAIKHGNGAPSRAPFSLQNRDSKRVFHGIAGVYSLIVFGWAGGTRRDGPCS